MAKTEPGYDIIPRWRQPGWCYLVFVGFLWSIKNPQRLITGGSLNLMNHFAQGLKVITRLTVNHFAYINTDSISLILTMLYALRLIIAGFNKFFKALLVDKKPVLCPSQDFQGSIPCSSR